MTGETIQFCNHSVIYIDGKVHDVVWWCADLSDLLTTKEATELEHRCKIATETAIKKYAKENGLEEL